MEKCSNEEELKETTEKYEQVMLEWAKTIAKVPPKVTEDDIYEVVSQKAKIPLSELKQDEAKIFLNLIQYLFPVQNKLQYQGIGWLTPECHLSLSRKYAAVQQPH